MKKLLCVLLSVLMILPAFVFAGCGKAETLKFGLGVYTNASKASDATEDTNGQGFLHEHGIPAFIATRAIKP